MNQAVLEKAILATVVYYDALGNYPLTAFETYKYLTNPFAPLFLEKNSFKKSSNAQRLCQVKLWQIIETLENSQKLKKFIKQKNGFYFLINQKEAVEERIERQKIADKKWKKIRRIAKWLQIIPYIQTIAVSGSLSLNNTKKESDLDLLISTKYGRIWTTRTLLSGLTQLIGQRRHGQTIKDKICLNQYTTDRFLEMPLKNLSNAHAYARLTPLLGLPKYQKFLKNNPWIKRYLPLSPLNQKIHLKIVEQNKFLNFISRVLEFFLNTKAGDFLEKKLGQWQKKKVFKRVGKGNVALSLDEFKKKNRRFHLALGDDALIFHYPISRNLEVQNRYYFKMAQMKNYGKNSN